MHFDATRHSEPGGTAAVIGAIKAILAAGVVTLAAHAALGDTVRGPITNLPLPRYVSLKATEGNVRRGPSLGHRVDWVFTRRDMPLRIVAEHGHWRRVQDRDGQGGWVHYSLLSGVRTVIVENDLTPMLAQPDTTSQVNAYAEAGVVARLGECSVEWCRVSAGGKRGWVTKSALWGVRPDEIRD